MRPCSLIGQELRGLPGALGITATDALQSPEEAHGHLQDVGLLHLGVGLLLEELGSQESLELLDAAVDPLSP